MTYPLDARLLAKIQAQLRNVFCYSAEVQDLEMKMEQNVTHSRAIQQGADNEGRSATEEEEKQILALMAEFDEMKIEKDRRVRMEDQAALLEKSAGRATEPEQPGEGNDSGAGAAMVNAHQSGAGAGAGAGAGTTPAPARSPAATRRLAARVEEQPTRRSRHYGFNHFGEFASCVRIASANGGQVDGRLRAQAPTETSSTSTDADGGFAVPPDFREEIMRKVIVESPLFGFTDQLTSTSNNISFPKDETTPWQSSGGIRVNWTGEAQQIAQSKVALEEDNVKLNKLTALIPVTEELLADAPALGRYLQTKVPENMGFKLDDAVLNGTGTSQPLGILNSPALVTVDEATGQAAGSIVYQNIVDMWAKLYGRGQNKAIWVVSPSVSAQLMSMSFPGAGTAVPVYLPPSGLAEAPYAKLLGRPVIATEAANAMGDVGDIILMDPSKYLTVTKSTGMRADTSMHLFFDYDVTAFRFIMRVGGKPWWSGPILSKDGVTEYSAFVALAERAGSGGGA
jgi:HK97 family phage major capsid protein